MILFFDSFDHYATADIAKKWNAAGASHSIQAASGRRSGGCLRMTAGASTQKTFTAAQTVVIGCAVKLTDLPGSTTSLFRLLDGATNHVRLAVDTAGHFLYQRLSTTLATSSNAIAAGTWYYIELKVKIDDTVGTYELRVNGSSSGWLLGGPDVLGSPSVATDTRSGGNASVDTLEFTGMSVTVDIDDLYILNTSGGAPTNDFLGDVRVDLLTATSDANYKDFTPSTGTDHYALVDEATPNTSDYNESGTAGHRDSYGMSNLSVVSGTIYGVQTAVAALKDDAGARSLKVGVRTNSGGSPGSTSLSAAQTLSTSQTIVTSLHETDPSTGAAWTEAGVNGAETVIENV